MASADLAVLQADILDTYYADNARKLHKTVDKILVKFGGLSGKDKDDFYSLANEVFADVIKRYDHKQSFDGFLYSCLSNKIMTEITRRNREKRRADRMSISIDTPIGEDEDHSLMDCIASDFDTFDEVIKEHENERYQDKVQRYLSKLSNQQIGILNLLIDGFKPYEIRRILEISEKEYSDELQAMRSFENVKILFQI